MKKINLNPNLSLNLSMNLNLSSNKYNVHNELFSTLKITWFQILNYMQITWKVKLYFSPPMKSSNLKSEKLSYCFFDL